MKVMRYFLVTAALLLCSHFVRAQLLYDTAMWVPNGPVHSMVRYNNELIIGGDFNYVGKATGYGLAIDTVNGNPWFPGFPEVDGPVYAVFPDAWGGWYIGGDFSLVGGQPRKNLAHISKSGHLYPGFNPSPDGPVRALWIVPSKANSGIPRPEVYVGGDFQIIGGEPRAHLAVLNPYTGAPYINWDPVLNGTVRCIEGRGKYSVYVGGDFTTVNGFAKNRFVEISQVNGMVFTPETLRVGNLSFNGSVESMLYLWNELYIGGSFTTVDNQTRRYLVKYAPAGDSIVTGFDPQINGPVYSIARKGYVPMYGNSGPPPPVRIMNPEIAFLDTSIIVGGMFSSASLQPRSNIAEVSIFDGAVLPLNIQTNGPVYTMNWSRNNGDIFIGGDFTLVNGQPRRMFAKTDSVGVLEPMQFNVSDPVRSLALNDSVLYVGGEFVCRDGVTRNNLAAIDLGTKIASSFNHGTDRYVTSMVLTPSGELLLGGNFLSVNGQPRTGVAGIDLTTSTVMPFTANANGLVRTITRLNDKLYFGGLFTTVNSISRQNIACVNFRTGQLENWHPSANGTVNSMEAGNDRIWVGGYYTYIGGFPRTHLAAVDTMAGFCVTTFSVSANDGIYDLDVDGSRLYLGGWFTNLAGQTRNNSGAVDAFSGALLGFNPNASTYVRSIQQMDASTVVIGGDFALIGNQPRNHMALLNAQTGALLPLDPNLNRASLTYIKENNILYTGGLHSAISGRVHPFLNAINLSYTPGMPELADINSMKLFPNPANDVIHVQFEEVTEGILSVFDVSGKRVSSVSLIKEREIVLDVSFLDPGYYLVRMEGKGWIHTAKVIIQ